MAVPCTPANAMARQILQRGTNVYEARLMRAWKPFSVRLAVLACGLLALVGCTAADYATGVNSFSQAVSAANSAEQTLITATQQVNTRNAEVQAVSTREKVFVDLTKCAPLLDQNNQNAKNAYKAGDCAVTANGIPLPPKAAPSSFASLTKYAAELTAVVNDKTCASVQTDAKGIASTIGTLAKDAGQPELAAAAGAIATIASTLICLDIQKTQLDVLKAATQSADPIIQKMVPIIADKDTQLYLIVRDDNVADLSAAADAYVKTPSAGSLATLISQAQAIDKADQSGPGQLVLKIATLHTALTNELQHPHITWTVIVADTKTFITEAQAVQSAINSLEPSPPPAAKKPVAGPAKAGG